MKFQIALAIATTSIVYLLMRRNDAIESHGDSTYIRNELIKVSSWFTFQYPGKIFAFNIPVHVEHRTSNLNYSIWLLHHRARHAILWSTMIQHAQIFNIQKFPISGKFGSPQPNRSIVTAMVLAVFTTMLFSIGGFFACARIAQVPSPPFYAINRGDKTGI